MNSSEETENYKDVVTIPNKNILKNSRFPEIQIGTERHKKGNRSADRIRCELCDKEFRRSNKSFHYKSQRHQQIEQLDQMYREKYRKSRTIII